MVVTRWLGGKEGRVKTIFGKSIWYPLTRHRDILCPVAMVWGSIFIIATDPTINLLQEIWFPIIYSGREIQLDKQDLALRINNSHKNCLLLFLLYILAQSSVFRSLPPPPFLVCLREYKSWKVFLHSTQWAPGVYLSVIRVSWKVRTLLCSSFIFTVCLFGQKKKLN